MNDAALAIMAKIRLLYEGEDGDSFLAFNPVGVPMTAADFAFVAPDDAGVSPQQRQRAAADFATLANLIPRVEEVWLHDGRLLWNEYGAVFRLAEVASDELSDGERAELDAAYDLLYEEREATDPATGETYTDLVESPTYEAYRRHQRAYREARERREEARLTAEHATDPDVREEAEAKRDELAEAVEEALRDWRVEGHRNDVEEALADVDRLTGRGPQLLWRDWAEHFRRGGPESDVVIDRPFYRTTVWPTDFYRDDGTWTEVTLDGSEVSSLVAQARETMPGVVDSGLLDDPGQGDLDVARVSVELARVEIVRPWFDPGVLRSRVWRWSHGREALSDGGDPPRGSLPAYATSMVFARNLRVDVAPGAGANERTAGRLREGLPVAFGPMLLEPVPSTADPASVGRLETAAFDPEETAAIREVARETAVAGPVPAGGRQPARLAAVVDRADVIERSPALADAATVIAGTNVRARPTVRSLDSVAGVERLPFRSAVELRPRPGAAGRRRTRDHREDADDGADSRGDRRRTRRARSRRRTGDHRRVRDRRRTRDHRTRRGGTTVVRDHRTDPPVVTVDPGVVEPDDSREPTGLEGRVTERGTDGGGGDPVEAVRMTFEQGGTSLRRTARTDEDGRYRVELPPGRYRVFARRFGYVDHPSGPDPWGGLVSLPAGGYQEYSFSMERDPAEQPRVETWKTMQLVAFVCAEVPEAPNPDPELTWS